MINNPSALEFLCITIKFQSYILNDLRNTQCCAGLSVRVLNLIFSARVLNLILSVQVLNLILSK